MHLRDYPRLWIPLLVVLETIALGAIVFARWIKLRGIARWLHSHGLPPVAAVWGAKAALVLAVRPPWLMYSLWMWLMWLFVLRQRSHYPKGCCPHCGYDMRATPRRCPECGFKFREDDGQ